MFRNQKGKKKVIFICFLKKCNKLSPIKVTTFKSDPKVHSFHVIKENNR